MSKLIIDGNKKMEGEIEVQGAKNAVLPILAATILSEGKNVIHNCPRLSDVDKTIEVLKNLGCKVVRYKDCIEVDAHDISSYTIPEELMRQMRSSIVFLGAIIAKFGKAEVSMPGGCEIGVRPIDLHLKALRQLGVEITESHGYIHCVSENPQGAKIHLDFPSVGATENTMLAACMTEGTTIIENAAREPEIEELQNFLNRMGARISGAGGDTIVIDGVRKLYGVEYSIMPDRIVSATYLACGAASKGTVVLKKAKASHMGAMINVLEGMGNKIYVEGDKVILTPAKKLTGVGTVKTMPYPGFPTDIQSPFMALATGCEGTSIFVENIFENRFRHIEELVRMGADIKIDGRVAVVIGTGKLTGAKVVAKELRGGAALVIAGLLAEGKTEIENVHYIDRGYESIENVLASCGVDIKRRE
ncbi:MAG: UDP-N-acetylglucosamine 1-carboxyvinyltransferase [Ruminococcaceae bacterium]|nr:UDP-N-acetylglucosamine 1-carboxyvinyltransferase [Oscillospiraceae bacterium]